MPASKALKDARNEVERLRKQGVEFYDLREKWIKMSDTQTAEIGRLREDCEQKTEALSRARTREERLRQENERMEREIKALLTALEVLATRLRAHGRS